MNHPIATDSTDQPTTTSGDDSAATTRTAWHILSYPRSGSHLVRALMEYCSQRPTEGCLGTRHDIPIAERSANRTANIIQITNPTPIGFKSHFTREVFLRNQTLAHPLGLIFITRNPSDAIASQLTRKLHKKRWLPDRARRERIRMQQEVEHYLSLKHLYDAHESATKIHVQFESLVSNDTGSEVAQSLMNAAGIPAGDLMARFSDIKRLAKDSQKSLPRKRFEFRNSIKRRLDELYDFQYDVKAS